MKKSILLLVVIQFFLWGCGSKSPKPSSVSSVVCENEVIANEDNAASPPPLDSQRKLTKDGSISFTVKNPEKTTMFIKNEIKRFGGYISSEKSNGGATNKEYNISIEVPSANFDSLLQILEKFEDVVSVENRNIEIHDVTSQYIDLEARMKIKKASEQKMLALLDKAKTLTETLAVEKQLTELRAEIESDEGQFKYLNQQISYSTLDVNYYEKDKKESSFWKDFFGAISNGWTLFLNLMVGLANLWMIIVFGIVVFYIVRKMSRKKKS
ncbi:MAG: DUF4349 domain-containing protein [Bacteroidales bacterium]|nr:DUF4349 domain-containing protein [Bacteroidales bacterium]